MHHASGAFFMSEYEKAELKSLTNIEKRSIILITIRLIEISIVAKGD